MKEGKVWGETSEIFFNDAISVNYLEIKRGGFCSVHRHHKKSNVFYIISGKVRIVVFRDGEEEIADQTTLNAGESISVAPLLFHYFEALEESRMIEIYEVKLDRTDIDRRTIGGVMKS